MLKKETLGPWEPCLEESAHRTPERVALPEKDYLSRGFSLTNTKRVDNGQYRVFKQSP